MLERISSQRRRISSSDIRANGTTLSIGTFTRNVSSKYKVDHRQAQHVAKGSRPGPRKLHLPQNFFFAKHQVLRNFRQRPGACARRAIQYAGAELSTLWPPSGVQVAGGKFYAFTSNRAAYALQVGAER
jgi:hypothetical protein